MNVLKNKIETMTNLEIKEAMFLLAPKEVTSCERIVWAEMFEVLESRLSEVDFEAFMVQLEEKSC